jgi:hypothetical protein
LLKVGRLGSNHGIHRPGEKKNNRFAEFLAFFLFVLSTGVKWYQFKEEDLLISNEPPRRKRRGVKRNICDLLATSGGELIPEKLEISH